MLSRLYAFEHQSIGLKPNLTFGCRMLGTISSGDGGNAQDTFQKSLYLEDLPQRVFVDRNTGRDGSLKSPFNMEDFQQGIAIPNLDGHGFVAYKNGTLLTHYRMPQPMAERKDGSVVINPFYQEQALETLELKPDVMLAHIRARAGTPATLSNSHPFTRKIGDDTWSLMHNGSGNAAKEKESIELVKAETGFETKDDTTWSEVSFFNFVSRMEQARCALKQHDSEAELNNAQIKKIFAETVHYLDGQGQSKGNPIRNAANELLLVNPKTAFLNLQGAVQHAPSSTFVTTNGALTLAVSSGRILHLGKVQYPNGEYDYVLASELPKHMPNNLRSSWLQLPEHHVLSIEKQADGELKIEIEPINQLIGNTDKKA